VNWRVGVVGFPIEHSLSPQLHEFGLRRAGLIGSSERIPLPLERAGELVSLMGNPFDALSVTMPLKKVAAEICHGLDPVAQRLGVVNTLRFRDGVLEGCAFDGPGFISALEGEWGVSAAGLRVLIDGAGGSALAIVDALATQGAASITVRARNPESAERLRQISPIVQTFEEFDGALDLVINTTPSSTRAAAFVDRGISAETVAIDVTYDPLWSPWRQAYADHGCRTSSGLAMLAYQAALTMQWWWGVEQSGHDLLEAIS